MNLVTSSVDERTMTVQDLVAVLNGTARLPVGIWIDADGELHFSVPDLLDAFDLPNTPWNRHRIIRLIIRAFHDQFPDISAIHQDA